MNFNSHRWSLAKGHMGNVGLITSRISLDRAWRATFPCAASRKNRSTRSAYLSCCSSMSGNPVTSNVLSIFTGLHRYLEARREWPVPVEDGHGEWHPDSQLRQVKSHDSIAGGYHKWRICHQLGDDSDNSSRCRAWSRYRDTATNQGCHPDNHNSVGITPSLHSMPHDKYHKQGAFMPCSKPQPLVIDQ